MSRRHGESLEFAELRPYEAGDDLRTVDWNAFRRLRKLLVRRYRAEESQDIYILLDISGSMEVPEAKHRLSRQIAGAIAVLAAGEHDRYTLMPFSDLVTGRFLESRRGRLPVDTLRTLSGLVCEGETGLRRSAEMAATQLRRGGLVVLISDFFDPGELGHGLRTLTARGTELLGIQIYAPEEARPTLRGPVTLVDRESGEEHEITGNWESNRAYLERFESYQRRLDRLFHEVGAEILHMETGTPLNEHFLTLFAPDRGRKR